jgi:hypothetical protein
LNVTDDGSQLFRHAVNGTGNRACQVVFHTRCDCQVPAAICSISDIRLSMDDWI